ncbi:MAG TPA: hypothetical protein DEF35_04835 [Paenibacillus sp.]|uniref:DUF1129 family protein n=1 Tax=Paenibacillus taichungensis TaxID=484184 RepID=UPI000E8FD175|nr:DUF1129 family protein [Paenibacillus taichungensis]HBU80954.1 hypothetical protein [Paenibacillus sp.]
MTLRNESPSRILKYRQGLQITGDQNVCRQGEQSLGISYKKLKEIQNRQMTEMSKMTPEHVKLFDQISTIARQAPADERTQEEWILSAGRAIVQAQRDGKPARELYGPDLQQDIYSQLGVATNHEDADPVESNIGASTTSSTVVAGTRSNSNKRNASAKKAATVEAESAESPDQVKRTPKWYVMISWAALSFVMLIQGAVGLFVGWTGGDTESFSHISLFSLIVAAVGGIALVEMLRRLAERPDDQGADKTARPQVNLRGIAIYIVIVVLVLFVGYPLRDSLPVFTLAPWISLVIGIVGLATLRPLFGQKKA